MSRSAPHKAFKIFFTILVVVLPVVLALWFAQIRAREEISDRLQSFSQLALQKTEMVIHESEQAREKAMQFTGELCSPQHQHYMLNIVRGLLYVDDLIYANGNKFICSTAVHPEGVENSRGELHPPARRLYLLLPRYAVLSGL